MNLRDFFIALSENRVLNAGAQKFGLRLGAQSVVAGTTIPEVVKTIKRLNAKGIACTVDNLGEFVNNEADARAAKDNILAVIETIHAEGLNAHISLKPTQLGLSFDQALCYDNLYEIVEKAHHYGIFINFDTETYETLHDSFALMARLHEKFDNVGTVIQAYFYEALDNAERFKDYRLRLVKGAYKENASLAYQTKEDIDKNYIKLIEYHLLHGKFTSIATHDHTIIAHVKQFVKTHNISHDKFEFQMLYGFRSEMQYDLAAEGFNFCTYLPFGADWYGYFMRRLAERPQNLELVVKQVVTKKSLAVTGLAAGAFLLGRLTKRK